MNYTLQNIHTARSYEALKRNGFSDLDIVAYYGTDIADRPTMFKQLKNKQQFAKIGAQTSAVTPQQRRANLGAQMCTAKADIDGVRDMALVYMEKDWTYRGRTFNLSKLNWRFGFHDKKRANGTCYAYQRRISLSQWVIENSERGMEGWINTMVHEIAHAINHILGGRGHDAQWRAIFISFGGTGDRCSKDVTFADLLKNPVSKYTLVCPNGHHTPSHKVSRVVERGSKACGKCCNEFNGGKFTTEFRLTQIKNY